ncbi:MAG: hypothetical protein J5523_02915 [Muribaculaceae bacterium]|nr:hypothetical protein [Muribaculaceae bacterium]
MKRIIKFMLLAILALPVWAETKTVCEGSASSEFVPVYGYWIDTKDVESQVIYPSSKLNLTGGNTYQIDAVTFHSTAKVSTALEGATVIVRMGETYSTKILTRSEMVNNRNKMDVVYQGHLKIDQTDSTKMTIEFQTPYPYQGNNLMIDIYTAVPSEDCDHCYWKGVVAEDTTAWNNKNGGELFLPQMTITYSEYHEQVLDFGKRAMGENVSYTATVTVENSANATVEPLKAPFSVESRDGDTFTIKFAPRDAASYTDYLVVNINGKNTKVRVTGIGTGGTNDGPVATRDEAFFKNITYTWTDSEGTTHTSNLSETATDPDQMIAMLKKVYTDRSIPGNLYRSNAKGSNDNYNDVLYTAVGKINRTQSGSWWSGYTYSFNYEDSYGWGIDGTIETTNSGENAHFKIDEYQPTEEGVTLLLLEQVDKFDPSNSQTATQFNNNPTHDYAKLRQIFKESIKSVRVVTEAKRTGNKSDYSSGTLFKIDCDKMNNFFFLAKGQLCGFSNNGGSYYYPNSNGGTYYDNGLASSYLDKEPALFCHMFEQLSPAQTTSTGQAIDIYQQLINGDSFPIVHECPCIPYCFGTGHGFSMYNSDYSGDCADVRDMMFFVPDYRMMYHSNRTGGNSSRDYFNYNTEHAPTMGLYVIDQDPITGERVTGKDMYQLTLKWNSNLDKFLPSDQQEYQLFQVVLDEDGTEQYVPVYYMNSDGQYLSGPNGSVVSTPVPVVITLNPTDSKTYTEVYIPMQESSQQVTFAVRGQDATHFLDLKTSNTRDFVIPGLDPNELVELTDATHYSRFNPQTVKNCYSNKIAIANTAMGLVNNDITGGENGTKLTIVRSHTEGETTISEPIAYITFDKTSSKYTVTMANQSAKSEYPNGKTSGTGAGYHANGPSRNIEGNGNWQQSYTVSGGYINFGSLSIYDNFVVSVADNAHPNNYTYQMTSNYAGTPSSIYLNIGYAASTLQAEGAVFYACTWNNGQPQKWVKGESMNSDNTLFRFALLKDNFIFCRMNPACENEGNEPSWDYRWNQSGDKTISGNLGKTYYVWSDDPYNFVGDWSSEVISEYAHSNTFRVPVFKTDSKINNVYTQTQVDSEKEAATGDEFENDNLTFEEKLQYSSKKTILRYDVYRWEEAENRFIVDKVTGKDNEEEDLSPDGQADNQDGSYTTKMNTIPGEDVSVPYGSTDKWASFFDDVPEKESEAKAYIYAPVVETFSTGKTSNDANKDRTDYNTYGGPLKGTSIGKLTLSVDKPIMSDYTWTNDDGDKYAYYNATLSVQAWDLPQNYDIYKIRVWREADEDVLGEEYEEFADRASSVYKFEEISYTETDKIGRFNSTTSGFKFGVDEATATVIGPEGQKTVNFNLGTFGARKVGDKQGEISSFDIGFFVRIYFTSQANFGRSTRGLSDADYYMVQAESNYTIKPDNVITAVNNIGAAKQVVGVSYVNTIGQVSSTPWQGVNVVVTRYSDGSVATSKMMK